MAGTFYHSVGALAPWLAVGAVEALCRAQALLSRGVRRRLPFGPLGLGLLFLVVAQVFLAWPVVAARILRGTDLLERDSLLCARVSFAECPPAQVNPRGLKPAARHAKTGHALKE